MATDYKVPYTTILAVNPHSNAERLEVATIYGFQVIVQKNKYKAGDKVIYIPIDSILPEKLEAILFPPESKVKLNKRRVRQIKLRGLASQGMVVDPADVSSIVNPEYFELEQDLSSILGVEKYEPEEKGQAQTIGKAKPRNRKTENPNFHQYNGLNNIKWFPDLFTEGEEVVIQEKLHGTNARAGKLPYVANTLWKKVLKFLHLTPKYENCYGSNKVEISSSSSYRGFYGEDIYGDCFSHYGIFDKLKPGEVVYGEIIGPGIQKGYDYGCLAHRFVVFDIKVMKEDKTQVWLTPSEVEAYCSERGLEYVPVLYKGPYNKELAYHLTKGPSKYNPVQKIREGIAIKAAKDYCVEGNKKALKWVSEDYLADDSNTDFH